MRDVVGFAVLTAVCVVGAIVLLRLARWARRRGVALMSTADELYHPNAHRFRFVLEAQAQQEVPRPPAGDPPTDLDRPQ